MTKSERKRLKQIKDKFQLVPSKKMTDMDFLYSLVLRENKRYGLEKLANKILNQSYFADITMLFGLGVVIGIFVHSLF